MRLQRQLLLVSLLLFSVPWAGYQYIVGIDASLRFAQETSLHSTTQAIATVLAQEPQAIYPNNERLQAIIDNETDTDQQHALFFKTIAFPVIIDGYDDEWRNIPFVSIPADNTNTLRVRYRAGADANRLHLFFDIRDSDIIYHNPTKSLLHNGDRLVLVTGDATHYVLTTSAPGAMKAYYKKNQQIIYERPSIKAAWQENGKGYTIEVSIPMTLTNERLGFYIVNESSDGTASVTGSVAGAEDSLPAWFIYQPKPLAARLAIFNQPGTRLKVIDNHFWPLAQQGELSRPQSKHGYWLLRRLYRAILTGERENSPVYQQHPHYTDRSELHNALSKIPASQWYSDASSTSHTILSVAIPVIVNNQVVAAVLAEQSSDRFVALTDKAFNQLVLFSLAALSITGVGLLGYASWLSWRIRRLSLAAQDALSDDGELQNNLPHSHASDEIGDLTRSYNTLLYRVSDYTNYLKTLSRKLSHELRTPLAIIHSSLDNLEHCALDNDAKTYHMRAKDGANRLGNILTAMSEATRVEQSIQQAEPEAVNLAALLHTVVAAYRDLYVDHNVCLQGIESNQLSDTSHTTLAVPDLIVQMLDKLIDNAVDFCPKQGLISIDYSYQNNNFVIALSNDGPLLPEEMQHQLFDNMVSLRDDNSEQSHLGLGLHIAQLIVSYHDGKITAANQVNGKGVTFTITLPQKNPAEAGKGQES